MARQPHSLTDADHMRIDCDAFGFAETGPEDDARCLAADALEFNEFLHRLRNLAVMMTDQLCRHLLNESRLVPVRPAGVDIIFEFRPWDVHVIFSSLIFPVERLRDDVDASIGALGTQDGGDEQIKRRTPVQKRAGRRVEFFQGLQNSGSGES